MAAQNALDNYRIPDHAMMSLALMIANGRSGVHGRLAQLLAVAPTLDRGNKRRRSARESHVIVLTSQLRNSPATQTCHVLLTANSCLGTLGQIVP